MATSAYSYGKYFSSATATVSAVDSSHPGIYNRFENSNNTWNNIIYQVSSYMVSQNSDGVYVLNTDQGGIFKTYASHSVPIAIYSGKIIFRASFYVAGHGDILYDFEFEFSNGSLLDTLEHIRSNATRDLMVYQSASYAYISNIETTNLTFYFAEKKQNAIQKLYNPSNSNQFLTCVLPDQDFYMQKDTNTGGQKYINITLNVTTASVTITRNTRYIRNRTTSTSSYTLNKAVKYNVTPTFLNNLKDTAYAKGHVAGNLVLYNEALNHQDFISNSGAQLYNDLITGYTKEGTIAAGNTGITFSSSIITAVNDEGTSTTACTHTFSWVAAGYNFYRNSSMNQNITVSPYNEYNPNGTSILYLYVQAVSSPCIENVYLCLYDVDEGEDSYDAHPVNPVDYLDITGNTYQLNMNTYNFIRVTGSSTSDIHPGFWVDYNGTTTYGNWYIPETDYPGILKVTFTSSGETLSQNMFKFCVFNTVEYHNNGIRHDIGCSAFYHFTGNIRLQSLSISGSGSSRNRTSFYWLGVKKNNLEFIENSSLESHSDIPCYPEGASLYSPPAMGIKQWSVTRHGTTYTQPIAYADKLSTFDDLFDKMTMYHGVTAAYYFGYDNYVDVRGDFFADIWNGIFSSLYNTTINNLNKSIRYRYVTINGTDYSELNWPMRWYRYPYWTSATQTNFNYQTGLVMKFSSNWGWQTAYNPDIVVFGGVSETMWNNALNSNQSVSSGVYALLLYNGFYKLITGGAYPFTNIKSGVNSNWNYERRAIGNYELDNDLQAPNDCIFNIVGRVYDYFSDTVQYFHGDIDSSNQRYIGYEDTTNHFTIQVPPSTNPNVNLLTVYDRYHRFAVNDILFTYQYTE